MNQGLYLTLISFLALSAVFLTAHSPSQKSQELHILEEFENWKEKNSILYEALENNYRFQIFKSNFLYAKHHNENYKGSLKLGMTPFASMTNEEFKQKMTMDSEKLSIYQQTAKQPEIDMNYQPKYGLPKQVNWTEAGAVTPVQNQGQCGSCWAFSTSEALEGIYQIKSGNLTPLSVQQLIDCSTFNYGCNGGWPLVAMQYTQKSGIQTQTSYPYVSGNGWVTPCTYNESKVVFRNTGSMQVTPQQNAIALEEQVSKQPISVLVAAANLQWQLYSGGVMDDPTCSTTTDHAVLMTGYDLGASVPYYMIKNTWGPQWGEQGYCQIAITQNGAGICGVQTSGFYPEYNQ